MRYDVVIIESEEGFAASVPGLPGCHTQGVTEREAVENVREAIREYLEVAREVAQESKGRLVQVEV